MAKPIIPLEIWAYEDYILPNTNEPNKERPIDDLWKKGYDLGEKPACEEHNYLFHMYSSWLKYITDEQIPGLDTLYLKVANNLSDVPNKATARTNLDIYSKAESEARYVNVTGDVITGDLTVNRLNLAPASSDYAYIQASIPSADTTYFDFWIGDNPGNTNDTAVDRFRWCFYNPGGSFEMMGLHALNLSTANMFLNGQMNVRDSISTGTLNATNINGNNQVYGANGVFGNFTTQNNYAVVAGRHIARTVNGYGADANGNVNLPLPQQGVMAIRMGALQSFKERSGNERMGGGVMTSFADFGSSNYYVYLRPLQYLINGNWVTAGYV